MVVRAAMMRIIRLIFREQKTRLQIDWLTDTDERILEYLEESGPETPATIAADIDRSGEYVSDRCRQLAIRDLLAAEEAEDPVAYRIDDLGRAYLAGEVDAEELEERAGTPPD